MALLFLIALVNIELADWTSFPGKSCLTGMTPKTWSDWKNTGVAARLEECRQQCISSMLCGAAEIRSVSGFFCEQGKEQCVQPRDMQYLGLWRECVRVRVREFGRDAGWAEKRSAMFMV